MGFNKKPGNKINKSNTPKILETNVKKTPNLKQISEEKIDESDDLTKIKEFNYFDLKSSYKNVKNDILPYKSIDCIYNKRNIWLNLQHQNPAGIYYDIWERERWFPLITFFDSDEKEYINQIDIPAFYSFKNFCPPFPEDELIIMKKNILKSLNNGFKLTRNQKNLPTNIKKVKSKYFIY